MAHHQLFIDDAYITFRYAENLAAGLGITYNPGERVLGTTTPLYCLWLALWRCLGVPVFFTAILTGTLSVSFSALLLWRIGKTIEIPSAGIASALVLLFFPRYWEHMFTGMETTLAGALCLLVIWLDLRKSHAWCGIASALLILTRPDAASLVAAVILVRFLLDRRSALISAGTAILGVLPWAIFGMIYFGDPLPSSLAAKRLIHPSPWNLVLKKHLIWFVTEPALIWLTLLWLIGAYFIIRNRRELLALILWPIFFLAGMAAIEIGPFYWYKIPLLPGYFLVAVIGAWFIFNRHVPDKKEKWWQRAFAGLITILILSALAMFSLQITQGTKVFDNKKEVIYKNTAEHIRERGSPGDKVYVGEVGVLGYYLQDFYIIDSSGLNSPEVYRIRAEDRKRILQEHPGFRYDWWGSPEWSREIINKMKPEFITSDARYLHLRTLVNEAWFLKEYEFIKAWSEDSNQYLLFQRAKNK